MYAAYADHPEIIKFLIDRGALITAPDMNGQTSLHLAVSNVREYLNHHIILYECVQFQLTK